MWVAKGVLTNNIYSCEYNCVYSCQCFIDRECEEFIKNELIEFIKINDIENKLRLFNGRDFVLDLNNKSHYDRILLLFHLVYNNPIRCFNIKQNRYADSWDF